MLVSITQAFGKHRQHIVPAVSRNTEEGICRKGSDWVVLISQYSDQGGDCRIRIGSEAAQPLLCGGLFIWIHASERFDNLRN